MLKKNLLNLFLLITVILLILSVFFSKKKDNLLPLLTNINPDSITKIIIRHNNHESLIRKQTVNGKSYWRFIQPIKVDANGFRLQSLLALINAPVHAHYKISDINPESIGLDKTSNSVQFDGEKIVFGIINPVNHLRYILYKKQIYLIQDVYFPLINSDFSTLVSLKLLPHNSKIKKLALLNQKIVKNANGLWKSSIDLPADTVVNIIQKWKIAQAFGVHRYMRRQSLGKVEVYLESSPTPIIFQVTSIKPWVILARHNLGLEYHLNKGAYNLLINPVKTSSLHTESIKNK